jgi:tetrapyrrole methylase family protein / MazG family protein
LEPSRLIVVGLGPAGADLLTTEVPECLRTARTVFLRTARHPAAASLSGFESFDHHYDESDTFEEVYARIVEDLVEAAQRGGGDQRPVVYAVPGSPLIGERTVELLRADPRVSVEIVPALSFLDLAWNRLGIDPFAAGVRIVDAMRFATEAAGDRGPLLVGQCWSERLLSEVKLAVDPLVGEAQPEVTILHHLGLPDERIATVSWEELDRTLTPDHLTSLWIPRLSAPVGGTVAALVELMAVLRQRCPWDREQTHASLSRHLLEEAYECIDALDELEGAERTGRDIAVAVEHVEEELGDLLFQVVFHACLAAEEGRFSLAEVAQGVHDKLVGRHPNIFGAAHEQTVDELEESWELLKAREKGRTSVTDGLPLALPSLTLVSKLLSKSAAVKVPLTSTEHAAALTRELDLLIEKAGSVRPGSSWENGLTATLIALVRLARTRGVDAELALRSRAMQLRTQIIESEGESQTAL